MFLTGAQRRVFLMKPNWGSGSGDTAACVGAAGVWEALGCWSLGGSPALNWAGGWEGSFAWIGNLGTWTLEWVRAWKGLANRAWDFAIEETCSFLGISFKRFFFSI